MAEVILRKLTKHFGSFKAVDEVSLRIPDGEFLVLLGPSGCGKSTILRLISGLEDPTSGEIAVDGELINFTDPTDRNLAMVFQNYALYPHMTVYKNVAFPLETAKKSKQEIDEAVNRAAGILEIGEMLERLPEQLSGGQRQRVALARAIVREPHVFLMDEPLSNLDAQLRLQTRLELMELHKRLGITTIYVTHDQIEAMTMGRRIAVMDAGKLQQVGPPVEVYQMPATTFVATFMGAPPMNLINGELRNNNGRWEFAGDGYVLELDAHAMAIDQDVLNDATGSVKLGIRPEHLTVGPTTGKGVPGVVEFLEPVGSDLFVAVGVGDQRVQVRMPPEAHVVQGDAVKIMFDDSRGHVFGADGKNLRLVKK